MLATGLGPQDDPTSGRYLTYREKVNADLLAFIEDHTAALAALTADQRPERRTNG